MLSKTRTLVLALLAGVTVAGCASSPYDRNTRIAYFTRGNAVLTPEVARNQREVVQPRCRQVAEETTPSRGRFVRSGVINGVTGGLVGGGAGYAAQGAITGTLSATTAGAGAVAYGLISGVVGGVQGAARRPEVVHYNTANCAAMDAGGLHQVAPSEGDAIAAGAAPPRSYGTNANRNAGADQAQPANEGDTPVITSPPQ